MPHSQTLNAIILQTHNVGEADRFCILFTKERGKLAARAKGVRKPKSKMGGSLLPFTHLQIDVIEGSAGHLITGAKRIGEEDGSQDITSFLRIEQGVDILLAVLHDEEPLPALFGITQKFLNMCKGPINPVLPFTLCLIHQLGLLPESKKEDQQRYIQQCLALAWNDLPTLSQKQKGDFSRLCALLLSDHTIRPLRAGSIASAMV